MPSSSSPGQPGGDGGFASQPSATARPPWNRGKRILLIAAPMALILVIALVAYLALWNGNDGETARDKTGGSASGRAPHRIDENLAYEFTEAYLNVAPDRKFSFETQYDLEPYGELRRPGHFTGAIAIYIDAGLSIEAPDASLQQSDGKVTIEPKGTALEGVVESDDPDAALSEGELVDLSRAREWGFSDQYFIVQKRDPKTGEALAKPLVTRFTVEKKAGKPVVSVAVDDQGVGHFTWGAVDGATTYYILSMDITRFGPEIIGATSNTEWTTIEDDKYLQEHLGGDDPVSGQNQEFETVNFSEDLLRDPDNIIEADEQVVTEKVYGVVAAVDEEISAFAPIDSTAIVKSLPQAVAWNAAEEMKASPRHVATFDGIPTRMPISMADGTTLLRPVVIDVAGVERGDTIIADADDAGNLSNQRAAVAISVPYTVKGTMFGGTYSISDYSESTYLSEVRRIADRNIQAQTKTGAANGYSYSAAKIDLSVVDVSTSAPTVPYGISASNSFTEYLAANMIAGSQYIDVSMYVDDKTGIAVNDAFNEALAQNPYILGIDDMNYVGKQAVLKVTYRAPQEERASEQQAISNEVDRVVAQIISDGMSEEQKVRAINDYIAAATVYDYDALKSIDLGTMDEFPHAWTPTGPLLDHKAVCGGYAVAFKVLADKAGLEAVYVSGVADGEPHAWNKVRVANAWRVVDVTWNDADWQPNAYLLLTDEQASKSRLQGDSFMIDSLVGNYAAR